MYVYTSQSTKLITASMARHSSDESGSAPAPTVASYAFPDSSKRPSTSFLTRMMCGSAPAKFAEAGTAFSFVKWWPLSAEKS